MTRYFVDIPSNSPDGICKFIESFDTREEAIAYAKENFGADDQGNVCLVIEVDIDEEEEDEDWDDEEEE